MVAGERRLESVPRAPRGGPRIQSATLGAHIVDGGGRVLTNLFACGDEMRRLPEARISYCECALFSCLQCARAAGFGKLRMAIHRIES